MVLVCSYYNPFGLDIETDYNAVGSREIIIGIEVFRQFIGLIGHFNILQTVEPIDFYLVAIVVSQDIPAVVKQLDAVRLDRECISMRFLERTIRDIDNPILFHRFKYCCQMVAPGWYLINYDTSFQREVLTDKIAHCEGIKHPFLQLILVYVFWIGNIIEIASGFLAVYDYPELAEDSVAPAIERGTMERFTVAQIFVPFPFIGQILVGNFPGTADCINQPGVFLQLVHIGV